MDLTTAAYLVIFLLSIAFLYDQATKRIPSRLDSNQVPKSRFELVPAGANGLPTRKDGFEYAEPGRYCNKRFLTEAVSSLSTA
ncbi:hypothetical protein B0H66DRAFT_549955 [Apodospora peruviana]|uniref:Uncharacterized protein n=1 Tax=Apodospora peruviana TaxID=516989 RepID=A0AAE0MB60_9PEZI|nr:hypothetical protein B0H66DRAFT_549955 [Apodospora peruviana]